MTASIDIIFLQIYWVLENRVSVFLADSFNFCNTSIIELGSCFIFQHCVIVISAGQTYQKDFEIF